MDGNCQNLFPVLVHARYLGLVNSFLPEWKQGVKPPNFLSLTALCGRPRATSDFLSSWVILLWCGRQHQDYFLASVFGWTGF